MPQVPARPLSRFHFFHSLGPQPRLFGALPAVEFPQRCPPPGRGGGGEQAQAGVGGNSPSHPPEPNSSESSDLPVLPRGLGGGQRRCVGGRGRGPREGDGGYSMQPYPVQTPCPSGLPAHPLLVCLVPWAQADLAQL